MWLLFTALSWQLLEENIDATVTDVGDKVCRRIGDECLQLLKRFKAAFVERSPRRGGNPIFVKLIRQVARALLIMFCIDSVMACSSSHVQFFLSCLSYF